MSASVIKHYPVMIKNVITKIDSLHYARPFKVADCNFGFGGHSREILKTFPNALM
jgi:16S rRNA C1402 N4-methylase RsmH